MRRVLSLGTRAVLFVGLFCVGLFALSACTASADAPGNTPGGTTPYDPEDPPDRVTTTPPPTVAQTSISTAPPEPDPGARQAELEAIVADHLLESFTALYEGDSRAFRATFYDDFAWKNVDGASALDANLGLNGPPTLPTVTVGTIHIDQPDCFVADIEFRIPERSQADTWPGATFRKTKEGHWTRGSRNRQWRCDSAASNDPAEVESRIEDSLFKWFLARESGDPAQLRAAHGNNNFFYQEVMNKLLIEVPINLGTEASLAVSLQEVIVDVAGCTVAEVVVDYDDIEKTEDGIQSIVGRFTGVIALGEAGGSWGFDGSWFSHEKKWSCYA